MKKVSLLVLLAIVASTLLMAAIPTTIVRLTIINKSGYDVYMKLEGSAVTQAFYYLTVPSGDRDNPTVKVFTVMSDLYKRTTWQCNGAKSSGTLAVDGNIRLTFTPCGEKACGPRSRFFTAMLVNPAWKRSPTSNTWHMASQSTGLPPISTTASGMLAAAPGTGGCAPIACPSAANGATSTKPVLLS